MIPRTQINPAGIFWDPQLLLIGIQTYLFISGKKSLFYKQVLIFDKIKACLDPNIPFY